jgi:hypothetical protein
MELDNYLSQSYLFFAHSPLCENNATPPDLYLHITDTLTCGDVHLQLSSIQQESQPQVCAAKQDLYRNTCCSGSSSVEERDKSPLSTALGLFVIFILVKRILSLRVRVVTADDGSISSSAYDQMDNDTNYSHSVKEIVVDPRSQVL